MPSILPKPATTTRPRAPLAAALLAVVLPSAAAAADPAPTARVAAAVATPAPARDVRAELARDPQPFFRIEARLGPDRRVYAAVRNRAGLPVVGLRFVVALVDRSGAVLEGPFPIDLGRQILQPDDTVNVPTGMGPYEGSAVLPFVRFQVLAARPLETPP